MGAGSNMGIALNMIVGPYAEPFIWDAIESAYPLVDDMVFVDTAPGNNPNREAMEHWVKTEGYSQIIDMPRGEDKDFSFGAARQLSQLNTNCEWILRLDADEVIHEDDIDAIKEITLTPSRYSALEISFYHFMVYPWLYQYIEPKVILYKNTQCFWTRGVHEYLSVNGPIRQKHNIKYYHYGYCRGQEEVFKRWQLYVDIDGRPEWYKGTNPATILSDRIAVCQNFYGEHPKVVQGTLDSMFSGVRPFVVKEIPRYKMGTENYVGLLLITYNDKENISRMMPTLYNFLDYPIVLHVIDMGSTDGTLDELKCWQDNSYLNSNIKTFTIERRMTLDSLADTMNSGFSYLMGRQECNYIGWIHPDMVFTHWEWLSELVATLQVHPEIGKICSYNPRDHEPLTEEIYDGHEQCYVVPRGVLLKVGLFDESFIGIGGWEDEDMNARITQEGLHVAITPKSLVYHKGMATRERRDTTAEQIHNAEVYRKKWGDNKRHY